MLNGHNKAQYAANNRSCQLDNPAQFTLCYNLYDASSSPVQCGAKLPRAPPAIPPVINAALIWEFQCGQHSTITEPASWVFNTCCQPPEPRGHEVQLFFDGSFSRNYLAQDFPLKRFFSLRPQQVCQALLDLEAPVLCFSVYSYYYQQDLALIRLLKAARPELIIICGGIHPTLLPERVLANPEIDFVVVGEGEAILPELLRRLEQDGLEAVKALPREALPGVWNRQGQELIKRGLAPPNPNLDILDFPDKSLHHKANPSLARVYTIVASRGCFNACTYCNSASINALYRQHHTRCYRVRSVRNVIEECCSAVAQHHPNQFAFFDDVFGAKASWLKEFCAAYKAEVGLPFTVQTSPLVHNQESLTLLAEAGCCELEFGFQSANPTVRKEILNRRESNEAVRDLILASKALGMFVELDLIVNLPGETPEHLEQNIDFIMETKPEIVNVGFLQYFPKTPIIDIALEQGLLEEADLEKIDDGGMMNSLRLLSKAKLSTHYRILPFHFLFASRLPNRLARPLIALTRYRLMQWFCSRFASFFIYFTRTASAFLDKRDFYVRSQIIASFSAVPGVAASKTWTPPPRSPAQ